MSPVAVGSDHAGFSLKEEIVRFLKEEKMEVLDLGTYDTEAVDYPDVNRSVGSALLEEGAKKGILICASSSCPPIDVYTAENLDQELDQAGRSFLKGGGLILDKGKKEVSLSQVFLWYGSDFGKTETDVLSRLADFVYDEDESGFLKRHAHELTVRYQTYDWRLNRGE